MSNIRNVFINSIGCVTKCGPAGILEGNTTGADGEVKPPKLYTVIEVIF